MLGVAFVLFTLAEYRSPELAGVVTFASIFPGIAISPIAGVLLDRHGRIRLIIADYLVAVAALILIAGLASIHALPPWLLVLIAAIMSLTSIFSAVGLRTLFPLIVPRHRRRDLCGGAHSGPRSGGRGPEVNGAIISQ